MSHTDSALVLLEERRVATDLQDALSFTDSPEVFHSYLSRRVSVTAVALQSDRGGCLGPER